MDHLQFNESEINIHLSRTETNILLEAKCEKN